MDNKITIEDLFIGWVTHRGKEYKCYGFDGDGDYILEDKADEDDEETITQFFERKDHFGEMPEWVNDRLYLIKKVAPDFIFQIFDDVTNFIPDCKLAKAFYGF